MNIDLIVDGFTLQDNKCLRMGNREGKLSPAKGVNDRVQAKTLELAGINGHIRPVQDYPLALRKTTYTYRWNNQIN
jgi:hypothetical protein